MRFAQVARLLGLAVVGIGSLVPGPTAAQDTEPVDVLVAQVGIESAPNMGLEMTAELAALVDARPGMISREWIDYVSAAALPAGFRSQLPEHPVCIHAMNASGFDAAGLDYVLCPGGRLRHDGVVDVQLRVWDVSGACWVFVPPEVVADRDAAVAYLDAAFANWLENGEPASVRCEESPGISMPLSSTSSPSSDDDAR